MLLLQFGELPVFRVWSKADSRRRLPPEVFTGDVVDIQPKPQT